MTNPVEELGKQIQTALSIIHSQASSNESRNSAQISLDALLCGETASFVVPACLYLLQGSGDSLGCHFALSTISKFIKERSSLLTEAEWQGLKAGLLSLFQGSSPLPFFVMSKLVDVVCEVAVRVWPSDWPELLPTVMSVNTAWGICVFARICDSLSEETLSVRCIAPERQLSLRVGITNVIESLLSTCADFIRTPAGSTVPQLQWVIELINGMCVATKQSSFLMKYGLQDVVLQAFMNCPDPAIKMLCVECISNFIHFLNGQGGRSYTVPRASREQDLSMLNGVISTSRMLLEPNMIKAYFEQDEMRDCFRAFLDLLTDIRKTSNIFSYFSSLDPFTNVLIEIASIHPSISVQITALANLDALLRSKQVIADRRIFLLCFLACHDFYTPVNMELAAIPPTSMFPHIANRDEIVKRRDLCVEECEEEDMKPNEMVGKLKNVALLCVRHITSAPSTGQSFIDFLKEILSETIRPGVGVSKSYYASLLFTEAVATTLTAGDQKRSDVSSIIDIVTATCPPGNEQDYLWFIGKAGALISQHCLQSVFQIILQMDISNNFPVQVAFISLCKNNPNSSHFVAALHQALQAALGGESRSWAIGAILSASAHGGVGAADGFATTVYNDSKKKLETVASSTHDNLEEFCKRSTPIFATLKVILEVPLSPTVSGKIASELASSIIPFCWTKLARNPGVFEIGPNEYLSVLGQQFVQSAATVTTSQMNACFQLYLLVTQVAGLCLPLVPHHELASAQPIISLFNESWNLRPSLINILVSNVASTSSHTRPKMVLQTMLPSAIRSLETVVGSNPQDDFTISSLSRAQGAVVQCVLNALQIATDDEFVVAEYSGAPKPAMTQKQLKAQLRSRNRFAAASEDAPNPSSKENHGPKIPYELLSEPEVSLVIISRCLHFRSDKPLRRIAQSIPTILTRWWNSVSNDHVLAEKFAYSLPLGVLSPILEALQMVRDGNPTCKPGGQLYSYSCERAVSGRKLASELVDHATISIHGVLSVLWRFALGSKHSSAIEPLSIIASCQPLNQSVRMVMESARMTATNEMAMRVAQCAKEQSLESRAALKYIVESATKSNHLDGSSDSASQSGVVRATSKDLEIPLSRTSSLNADDLTPPGSLFG